MLKILRSIDDYGNDEDETTLRRFAKYFADLQTNANKAIETRRRLESNENDDVTEEDVLRIVETFARHKAYTIAALKEKTKTDAIASQHRPQPPAIQKPVLRMNPCAFPPSHFLSRVVHFKPVAKRIMIAMVTQMRSGSSFIGKIFERSPDVLYFYEPLKGVAHMLQGLQPNSTLEKQFNKRLLDSIASCNFHNPLGVKFIDDISRSAYSSRDITDAFIRPPFCPENCELTRWRCPPLETKQVGELCASRRAVVVKLIRIDRMSELEAIAVPDDVKLHVLHLVRDPRATIFSRYRIRGQLMKNYAMRHGSRAISMVSPDALIRSEAEYLCSTLRKNLKYFRNRLRYRRVAFEDIARDPFVRGQELLQSYGLKFGDSVRRWLKENTHVESNNAVRKNPYATTRNSEEVADAWKAMLRIPSKRLLIGLIESECKDVMRELNYKLLVNV